RGAAPDAGELVVLRAAGPQRATLLHRRQGRVQRRRRQVPRRGALLTGAPHGRRAAVLGRPVAHSLSPVLHRASYAALGLAGWRYDAIDCDETGLPPFVDRLGPEWVGLSLTMPLKRAALEVADDVSPLASAVGAANTLL